MELEVSSQIFLLLESLLLQLVSFTGSPVTEEVCEQNTLTPRVFSHICTHFILVHMHSMTQGVAARVS